MPVRLPVMSARQERDLREYALHDAELEYELLTRMLPRFSRPEVEIPLQQHTVDMYLRPCLRLDVPRAQRIHKDMLHEVDKALDASGYPRIKVSGNLSFKRLLARSLDACGEKLPVKRNKAGVEIPAVAKTDMAYDELLNHWNEPVRNLMAARVALKSWPTKAKRVQNLLKQTEANGGILPVPLHYYGAHTGRWSGGEGINLQNLGARGHVLDSEVRNLLLPPPGHKLIVVDAAAVEARGLAWLAGEAELMEQFRTGVDVYCAFASKMFPYPIRRVRPTDPPEVAATLNKGRACGKVGVLGGGYGMGAKKCQDYGVGYGLSLSFTDAAKLINTYRSAHPKIVRFWKEIYDAFRWTHKTNRESTVGPLRLYADITQESEDVVLVLPSGRELRYANVAEQMGDRGIELICYSQRTKTWTKIYGGYLTENIVQALCRDLLADAVLALESSGIRVPLTVHDEIVAISPDAEASAVLDRVVAAMSASPSWAPALPLDATGQVMDYYGK